jgi:hypothetical protein
VVVLDERHQRVVLASDDEDALAGVTWSCALKPHIGLD